MKNLFLLFVLSSCILLNAQEKTEIESKYERGIYKTFAEFLNKKPSITEPFYIEKKIRNQESWKGTIALFPRYEKTDKLVHYIWDFSDGEQVYIYHMGQFFPFLINSKDNYSFIGYDTPEIGSIALGAVLGGAIGSSIAADAARNKAKKERVKYTIDPIEGFAIHPTKKIAKKYRSQIKLIKYKDKDLVDPAKIILYRVGKKEIETTFKVSVNSEEVDNDFLPNSYGVIELEINESKAEICLTDYDIAECLNLEMEIGKVQYVEIVYQEESTRPKLELQDTSKGEFRAYKPKKAQKKVDKKNKN